MGSGVNFSKNSGVVGDRNAEIFVNENMVGKQIGTVTIKNYYEAGNEQIGISVNPLVVIKILQGCIKDKDKTIEMLEDKLHDLESYIYRIESDYNALKKGKRIITIGQAKFYTIERE